MLAPQHVKFSFDRIVQENIHRGDCAGRNVWHLQQKQNLSCSIFFLLDSIF